MADRFLIDAKTQMITPPPSFLNCGVISDHNAMTLEFEIDRMYDGEDLSVHKIVVQYINAGKEKDLFVVSEKDLSVEDKIIFSWKISNHVTRYPGEVSYSISFYSSENNIYTYKYNTIPSSFNVLDGIVVGVESVSIKPDILTLIPTKLSQFINDENFISEEFDPTVPEWAKEANKPTYTASEVGALPNTTNIPTRISDLTDDSDFVSTSELNTQLVLKVNQTDFNTLESKTDDLTTQIENRICRWSGLTWNVLGDSITAFNNYQNKVSSLLGIDNVNNYGVGGTTITDDTLSDNTAMSVRYAEMSNTADLVTIFGGTNDFGHNKPLGTLSDTTRNTFYGALKVMLDGIISMNPLTRIAMFTPLKRDYRLDYGIVELGPNSSGKYLIDYSNAIKEVCEIYSVPVLDLYSMSGINLKNLSTYLINESGSYIHPNEIGFVLISKQIASFLNSI